MALSDHPNYDSRVDAMVAAWVLATKRKHWVDMSTADQAQAYMDFFVSLSDEDCEEFMQRFDAQRKIPKPN